MNYDTEIRRIADDIRHVLNHCTDAPRLLREYAGLDSLAKVETLEAEVERLKEEVDDLEDTCSDFKKLERELDAAEERIDELEEEIADLREQLTADDR